MRFIVTLLVTLLWGQVARAQEAVSYEAPLPGNAEFGTNAMFFPLGSQAWLVVHPDSLTSQVLKHDSLSPRQPIGAPLPANTAALIEPYESRGFVQKDGSVLLVWWQKSRAAEDAPGTFHMARYQAGAWSDRQPIPGQTKGTNHEIATDGKGYVLLLWQQPRPAPTSTKNKAVATKTPETPANTSPAWYYSVIAEGAPQPAKPIPGQPKDSMRIVLDADPKNHRVHLMATSSHQEQGNSFGHLYHGMWQGTQQPILHPLATRGNNTSPRLVIRPNGTAVMLWQHRKEGTPLEGADAENNKPAAWRFTELAPNRSAWGAQRISSEATPAIPFAYEFIHTPEGGLFAAQIDTTESHLRSWYLSPKGVLSTQHVPVVAGDWESPRLSYQALPNGRVLLAFRGTTRNPVRDRMVYTTTWDNGILSPVRLLPNQGQGAALWLQLVVDATGHAMLVWTQRLPNVKGSDQHVYLSYGKPQGFVSAQPLTQLTQSDVQRVFLTPASKDSLRVAWEETRPGQAVQIHMVVVKNKQVIHVTPEGAALLPSTKSSALFGWEPYTSPTGKTLYFSRGTMPVSSVCEQEHCSPLHVWKTPGWVVPAERERSASKADGSLLFYWYEKKRPPVRKQKPSTPAPDLMRVRVLHFPDFAADLY